jgi:biopolymer transport protein ExbD
MAGASVAEPKSSQKKGKKQQKKKRIPVRIDMTPMVDVVMLLITFFMLTTVFNTPQTMEINIPPGESRVEVAETSLLTLRVTGDGTIYWNLGIETPQIVPFVELRKLLVERLQANPKLITLVKVERESTYEIMVNVMDEMNLANITRFSLAPFQQFDRDIIKRLQPK